MIKNILRVILIAVILLIVAFVGLIFLVNPNQFRSTIEQAVLDNTGYQLTIAGDLDLRFTPYIGLTLNDVRLRNPAAPQELASTSAISLRVDPGLLLQRELFVSELRADDFHVNWYTNADGENIWDVPTPASTVTNTPSSASNSSASSAASSTTTRRTTIRTSFERIAINNASVDIQNLSLGTRYSVSDLNLVSSNASLEGQAFPVELNFTFLNNGITTPVAMGLRSDVALHLDDGTVNLTKVNFNLTPLLLQGQLALSGLNDDLQFEGSFETNAFDVLGLLQTLGIAEADAEIGTPALGVQPPLSLAFAFSGNQEQASLTSLTAALGASEIQGSADIRFASDFSSTNISYNIVSNEIDLTPFMSEQEEASEPVADAEISEQPVVDQAQAESTPALVSAAPTIDQPTDSALPLELLNSLNLLGSISIESITARNLVFDDINIFTNLEDGVLDIETQPVSIFDGTVLGNMRLDARGNTGNLTSRLVVNQVNVAGIIPSTSRVNSVTGNLDLEGNYSGAGSTVNQLRDSLSGATSFAITENSVDIGIIKQVFTAIAALSTTGEAIQQWPDVIRFQEFGGYFLLQDGIAANQQIKIRMDNFDVTGTGGIDLVAQTFDYDLLFTVLGEPYIQTIQINPRYHDVSWPVECAATFAASVTQYCRPDFAQVRQIFGQLSTNEVRRRLDDVVNDQVPEQLQDSARGLLRNLFN